jgi:hypothetical protein
LDSLLSQDKKSRVAVETLIPTGMPLNKPVNPMNLQAKPQDAMALPKSNIKSLPLNSQFQLPSTRSEP